MATRNLIGEASKGTAILPTITRSNMADDDRLCAICQNPYRPRKPSDWFCNKCWHMWYTEIHERLPWIKFCISSELSRRRQERNKARFGLVYLGDKWDIDNDGNLVYTDTYRTTRPSPNDYRSE